MNKKHQKKKPNQTNKHTHKQDDPKKVTFPIHWKENEKKKKLEIENNVIKTCS